MNTHTNSRTWMALVILVFAVIIAITGIIYGWQANVNSKIANQALATALADEQGVSSQVALAESTTQAALKQQANAERERQEARNAQATAESDAQQRALVQALTDQEVQAAQEEAQLATSRRLAAQSLNTLEENPQLSAHLALQAYETAYTFEAENALHQVLPYLRLLKSTLIRDIVPNANWRWEYLARNGELLAVGTDEGIEVVDMTTGNRSLFAQGMSCSGFLVSPDGEWLTAKCDLDDSVLTNNALLTWEIKSQELLSTISNLGYSLHDFGMIPPSSSHPLMLSSQFRDGSIHIWDGISGEERLVIPSTSDVSAYQIVASPDGNFLAIVRYSGLVELWSLDTDEKLTDFDPHSNPGSVFFSPDATRLAAWGNTIQIWDVSSIATEPILLQEIIPNIPIYGGLMYSPDGSRLVGCGDAGQVLLWQVETGRLSITLYGQSGSGYSSSLAFSQDGNHLYIASHDGTLNEWDVSPGGGLMALPGITLSEPYSPDGRQLALASEGGYVSIVDSQTGEVQLSWQAQTRWGYLFSDLAWSPDGERLATFYINDNTARIWEAATGRLLQELPVPPESEMWGGFIGIAWSPDGNRIATIDDYAVFVWDVDSGEQLLTLEAGWFAFPDLDFSPDGTKIAAGAAYCSDGPTDCYYELVIWDSTNGTELFRLGSDSRQAYNPGGGRKVLARPVNPDSALWVSPNWSKNNSLRFRPSFGYISRNTFAMDFSPDGKYLAAGTLEGIILWKFTPGEMEQVQVFVNPRHENGYYSLDFSLDGTLLGSSSGDGKIRIWDLDTGQVRWEVAGGGPVAFSPDGTRLVSSSNGITTIHVLPLDELTELVRERIIRPMTAEECLTYLHEVSCPP